jgi:hypothetical protein
MKMNYGYTYKATSWNEKEAKGFTIRLAKLFLFFIPKANPEHEYLYPHVEKWLLETNENGKPQREIGIGKNNEPLFGAPNDRNCGFWTDSNNTFGNSELEVVSKEYFESVWEKIYVSSNNTI